MICSGKRDGVTRVCFFLLEFSGTVSSLITAGFDKNLSVLFSVEGCV